MSLFLKQAAFFLIFLPIYLIVGIIIWGEFVPNKFQLNLNYKLGLAGHMNTRIKEIDSFGDSDIVVLGSSHAYRGFDPRIFSKHGFRLFNLGSSGQTPMQTKILVNRNIDKLTPELVIYEVYPSTFRSDGVESTLDLIANDVIDSELIRTSFKINNIKVYCTLIFGIWRQLFNLDSNFTEKIMKNEDRYISGGFVERRLQIYQGNEKFKPEKLVFKESQKQAFQYIIEVLKKKGIDIILVQLPITKAHYLSFENSEQIDTYFESTGLRYYNLNNFETLTLQSYFYDSHHLNQKGAEVVNNFLIEHCLPKRSDHTNLHFSISPCYILSATRASDN